MPIEMRCTGCGQTLRVGDEHAGKRARCPACGTIAEVPWPAAEVPWPAAEAQLVDEPSSPFSAAAGPPADNPFADRPERDANPYASPSAPAFGAKSFARPHRGGLILAFGIASVLCCNPLGMCCMPCGVCFVVLGAVLGVAAWVMGASDLSKIRAGIMNPEGESMTRWGKILGIVSVGIAILWVLANIGMLAIGAVH